LGGRGREAPMRAVVLLFPGYPPLSRPDPGHALRGERVEWLVPDSPEAGILEIGFRHLGEWDLSLPGLGNVVPEERALGGGALSTLADPGAVIVSGVAARLASLLGPLAVSLGHLS